MSEPIPRKRWKYRGVGPYVVGRWTGEFFDIYRGANTPAGARKARREISHWTDAQIYDQATDTYSGSGCA
jgi:hypothetical protein